MKKNFKSYIITESARAKHTLRFFDYEHNEHSDTVKKLRSDLEKSWTKISEKYSPIDISSFEGEQSKYFDKIEFTNKESTIGRFGNKSSVFPSVKIGGAYDKQIKSEVKKDLMMEAHKIFERYAQKLNAEISGNPFSISQEDGPLGEIRLKFQTGEFKKTIFMVAIEPGYKFERVYLKDYLDK